MKTKISVFLILLVLSLSSCAQSLSVMNYSSANYVALYDYRQISVEKDYLEIPDSDVETIIEMELSTNEIYAPVTERSFPIEDDIVLLSIDGVQEYYILGCGSYPADLEKNLLQLSIGDSQKLKTDNESFQLVELVGIFRQAQASDTALVLAYYDCGSLDEVNAFIRQRASQEILYNYALDIIFENTGILSLPPEIEHRLMLDIQSSKEYILQEYATFEDYLAENEMTETEFEEQVASWYYEPMIYKAILDAEGVTVTDADLIRYQEENQLEEYDLYEVYNQFAQQKVREILASVVEITE